MRLMLILILLLLLLISVVVVVVVVILLLLLSLLLLVVLHSLDVFETCHQLDTQHQTQEYVWEHCSEQAHEFPAEFYSDGQITKFIKLVEGYGGLGIADFYFVVVGGGGVVLVIVVMGKKGWLRDLCFLPLSTEIRTGFCST